MAFFQLSQRLLELVICVDGFFEFFNAIFNWRLGSFVLVLLPQVLDVVLDLSVLILIFRSSPNLFDEVLLLHLFHSECVAHYLIAFKHCVRVEVILSLLYAIFYLALELGLLCGCVLVALA